MNKPLSPAVPSEKTSVRGNLDFPVVGIGASAGGLEASIRFFEGMPADSGMAFVVVLHLSPMHESASSEVLQRVTAMPVIQVTKTTLIQRNHVYVISPNHNLSMKDGYLTVTEFTSSPGPRVVIDVFFRTLAEAHREQAFAIVLSGSGSDGAVGITRIKEQGGIILVQHPNEAQHDGMPLAAIAGGTADFILPVREIPAKLVELCKNARAIELPSFEGKENDSLLEDRSSNESEEALQHIIKLLLVHTGHDFRHYKRPTILRRIERRLQVRGAATLAEYGKLLEADPNEHGALLRDMLIGVTNFFRDKDAFDALETKVLPDILAGKQSNEQIRAWVPACSSGEEAYSIAMLISDQVAQLNKPSQIHVFASDIDERAIGTARAALYPGSIMADVPPERLQQYFTKEEERYRIRKTIRDRVLFAPHNILRDPPFSKLDLISCRNLLIYLNREMQAHVLEMFHFSLNPGGFLFLGSSESADLASNLFTAVDKKHRIYQVRALSRGRYPPTLTSYTSMRQQHIGAPPPVGKRQFSFAEVHQRVLAQYAQPSVIVNHDSDIVYMSEHAGRFLRHIGGEPSRNLVSLVHPELRVELRTALFQAIRSEMSVEARRVRLNRNDRTYFVKMTVRPFHDDDAAADFVLVLFDEVEQTMSDESETAGEKRDTVLARLEEELQRTKEQLQETIEHSEVSNEELRASNEELQAINEELRSATEELETSKEELQSVNEELSTVNYELKSKVEETSKINDDLNNLIASADIATIFMDRGMRIKRYTPRASDIFNLIPSDIGRPLLDITHRLDYPALTGDVMVTFDTLHAVEREVRSTDGRYYIVRHLPYRTTEDRIEGAVMTFFDITSRRDVELRLRAGEERMRLVAECMTDYAIITLDREGLITSWSKGAEGIYGFSEMEAIGRSGDMVFLPEDCAAGVPELEMRKAREEGRVENERWNVRKNGSRFFASGVMAPLNEGSRDGYAKIVRDQTERIRMENSRETQLSNEQAGRSTAEMANALKDEFLAIMSHELRNPLNLIHMNVELLSRLQEVQESQLGVKAVSGIRAAVVNQSKVIEDLLDLSRVQTGKLALSLSRVDFGSLVGDIIAVCKQDPGVLARHIVISEKGAPLEVQADRVRLEQVVLNIVGNAVKFTAPNGRIDVCLKRLDREVLLEVQDDGKGIDPEFLPHIFEMFKQANPGTSRGNNGLGIGLALARQIVELHGGRMEAESEGIGKGTCFRVFLPLRDATTATGDEADEQVAEHFQNARILLLDDNMEAVESFKYLLEYDGATVNAAYNAADALAFLADNTVDLIISDLAMPVMDGFAFIEEVRKYPAHKTTVAIAVSGLGRVQDAERALESGYSAHLIKPVSLDTLHKTMAGLLDSDNKSTPQS
ncbi:CheR family methyltransferase [Noviherbaspirillum saxi]|uniref:PAS domain S-box protein n=1 Tax=Noviherbaspirillum saxi TaxID=2320863 RepID=A0A3A3G103_9BURK|nr:CheR family methyltransferase [Noviherbaspirillum saxi]RJF95116.1 PAS domain S-box protein [Noviherbaspirillum saxi]